MAADLPCPCSLQHWLTGAKQLSTSRGNGGRRVTGAQGYAAYPAQHSTAQLQLSLYFQLYPGRMVSATRRELGYIDDTLHVLASLSLCTSEDFSVFDQGKAVGGLMTIVAKAE
jgi:hypothetical protein